MEGEDRERERRDGEVGRCELAVGCGDAVGERMVFGVVGTHVSERSGEVGRGELAWLMRPVDRGGARRRVEVDRSGASVAAWVGVIAAVSARQVAVRLGVVSIGAHGRAGPACGVPGDAVSPRAVSCHCPLTAAGAAARVQRRGRPVGGRGSLRE